MYQEGKPAREIIKLFPNRIKAEKTIIRILKKQGVSIRPRGLYSPIENENFFEKIDTERKAYILGLLLTDGYIIEPSTKKKASHCWGLEIKEEDKYLLDEILSEIGKDASPNKGHKNTFYITVRSNKMCSDLAKYGIVPRKTNTVQFPQNIDVHLVPHLIRGIFDGDGTVYINAKKQCVFGFYGNNQMLYELREILHQDIGLKKLKITDKGTVSQITFGARESVKKFHDYIYKDATIYLRRKRKKFNDFFNISH